MNFKLGLPGEDRARDAGHAPAPKKTAGASLKLTLGGGRAGESGEAGEMKLLTVGSGDVRGGSERRHRQTGVDVHCPLEILADRAKVDRTHQARMVWYEAMAPPGLTGRGVRGDLHGLSRILLKQVGEREPAGRGEGAAQDNDEQRLDSWRSIHGFDLRQPNTLGGANQPNLRRPREAQGAPALTSRAPG